MEQKVRDKQKKEKPPPHWWDFWFFCFFAWEGGGREFGFLDCFLLCAGDSLSLSLCSLAKKKQIIKKNQSHQNHNHHRRHRQTKKTHNPKKDNEHNKRRREERNRCPQCFVCGIFFFGGRTRDVNERWWREREYGKTRSHEDFYFVCLGRENGARMGNGMGVFFF